MQILMIYFLLVTFWLEQAWDFKLTHIEGLSLMNVSLLILLVLWFVKIVRQGGRVLEYNNINKYILFLIYLLIISIPVKFIHSEVRNISILQDMVALKSWINPLIIFFILYNIIQDEDTCKRVMLGLIVFLIVTVLSTQIAAFGLIDFLSDKMIKNGRVAGFVEPNQYASYIVLFVPLILTQFLNYKNVLSRAAITILLVMILYDLIASGSRGGFLSFLVSMAVYLFLLYRQREIRLRGLVGLLTVLLIIGVASFKWTQTRTDATVFDRFDISKADDLNDYTAGRLKILEKGIALFKKSPIFGHGHQSYDYLMKKEFGNAPNTHNDYLLYLVENGIAGFLAFILLYLAIFRNVYKQFRRNNPDWVIKFYISYLAGFAGYAFSMLTVNIFSPRYLFWIYTAIIYKYIQLYSNTTLKADILSVGEPLWGKN